MLHENYKTKVECGVSAIVILVGLFFVYQASTIGTSKEMFGPSAMPFALAISTVLGGIWLANRAFRGTVGAVQDGYGFLESDLKRIAWVIGSGAIFILTFYLLGYFLAIMVGYTLMLLSFGVRNISKIFFSTLLMAVIFQWLFMGVMRLNDPSGALFDLRPYTSIISGE
jgi:hypothetical protein